MKINRTTKRLLSLSFLNVTLSYAHSHRWLEFNSDVDCDQISLSESLEKHNISVISGKIYGSVIDGLDFVDFLLKKVERESLEEMFDSWNDWGFNYIEDEDKDNWENSGTETEEYFESRITTIK